MFYKDYPDKLTAASFFFDSTPLMAKLLVKLSIKQKQGHLTSSTK